MRADGRQLVKKGDWLRAGHTAVGTIESRRGARPLFSTGGDWRRNVVWAGPLCAACLAIAGCGEPVTNSGIAQTRSRSTSDAAPADLVAAAADSQRDDSVEANDGSGSATSQSAPGSADPAAPRTFAVEGPEGAFRISFDDLDLLKIIKMDDVTPDCVSKMPQWMRDLAGKKIRIRGFMKPLHVSEGLPEFPLVRSTDLCCFGPKGKVYHMAAVALKKGTTTDYIELKPFDVVGTFRIEPIELGDGVVFLLYHIDEATIIQK